jgi:hypothetical protein
MIKGQNDDLHMENWKIPQQNRGKNLLRSNKQDFTIDYEFSFGFRSSQRAKVT